jgi:ATP-dependent Lon protease
VALSSEIFQDKDVSMKDDWSRSDMPEDYAPGLHQRTEELYRIPDAEPDSDGLIEGPVFIMRDMLVYPRMISPVFIEPGANLLAIQESQLDETTMIALVQQDSDVDEPGPEDFCPSGSRLLWAAA